MPAKPRLLIIDDKPSLLKMLSRLFAEDYELDTTAQSREGLEWARTRRYDVLVTDIRMPDMDGMEILHTVTREVPETEVVLMTAYAEVQQAVEAMKEGAFDYIRKPFEPDELLVTVQKAVEHKQLKEQASQLREHVEQQYGFSSIIGQSPPMKQTLALAQKAARSDSTVLLLGESGTGKEVFARAIHYSSGRKHHRFVAINCGAMPKELIESELFGHVRGAFSGATQNKPGLFEEADNGTLFLDEITELNPDLQVKINRAIEEREIRRVGDTRDRKVDVRIIAASNRQIRQAVEAGDLREDLYYRLNVFPIQLPPLRERNGDIPLLVNHFLHQVAGDRAGEYVVEEGALDAMLAYDWPGNVRELRNAIERAVVLSEDGRIGAALLNFIEAAPGEQGDPLADSLTELPYKEAMSEAQMHYQRVYVEQLLRQSDGNVTRAAEKAQIERESFHRLMRKLGIRSEDFRD